jgi:hypothetical protein
MSEAGKPRPSGQGVVTRLLTVFPANSNPAKPASQEEAKVKMEM